MNSKTVICVTERESVFKDLCFVETHFPVKLIQVPTILDACNCMSTIQVALMCFDTPVLFSNSEMGVFDITALIQTFSKINKQAIPTMVTYVDESTTAEQIEKMLDTDLKGLVPSSKIFGIDDLVNGFGEALAGRLHLPRKLIDWYVNPQKLRYTNNSAGIKLTRRQSQIVHLITTRGASNKVIARMLKISESTVKLHVGAILKKYGVRNRTQLALCSLNGGKL